MQIEAQSLYVCVCVCCIEQQVEVEAQQQVRPTGDSGEDSSAGMDSHGICGQLFPLCLFPLIDPIGVIRKTLTKICCGLLTGRTHNKHLFFHTN